MNGENWLHRFFQYNDKMMGIFVIAFPAEILDGASPIDVVFYVKEMWPHIICCLENQKLTPFPKATMNFSIFSFLQM